MKKIGFGNKRVYVMTGEERDRLVSLIHCAFYNSGFVAASSLRALNGNFSDEDKKLYLESAVNAHDNATKLFRAFG